jgi:hypothetical protein
MQVPGSKTNPRRVVPLTRLGIISRCCSANPPDEAIPATVRHCAVRPDHLRDTVLPTFVRPMRRTLEGGRRNPRKGDGRPLRARLGRRRDAGPVRRVSSVTISPMQPSSPSRRHPRAQQHHPRRYGSVGQQVAATPAAVPLTTVGGIRNRAFAYPKNREQPCEGCRQQNPQK